MKVLKITSWYPTFYQPSSGSFVQDQAIALTKQGVDVGVLFVDMDLRKFHKKLKTHHFKTIFNIEHGIKVFRYYGLFPPKISLFFFSKWVRFYDIIFKDYAQKFGTPDILHAHNYQSAYAAKFLSEKYNIPYVVTEHSTILLKKGLKGWRSKILISSFNSASCVIAVSEGLKKSIQKYLDKKIIVIPNLIDANLFAFENKKIDPKSIQLISVGDLIPRKGFDLLINAFSKVNPDLKKNLFLKIIGSGREYNRLEKLIKGLGEEKQIALLGELPRQMVASKLQNSDIYILSSFVETFGIVLIEAMATGLPVIATKCGGPEDIITPEIGLLIPINKIRPLTEAIEKMCNSYLSYDSKIIRQHVLNQYSDTIVAKKLIERYQLVLSK